MSMAIETYLDRVMDIVGLRDTGKAAEMRRELRDHLEQKVEDLRAAGMGEADSVFRALEDHGDAAVVGYALRPRWPLVDVRVRGTARGIIAVGPRAVGVFASGGVAMGVFAFGGVSFGLVSWGGIAIGLLWAWGAVALSTGFAMGGAAVGTIAAGQAATGVVASGQAAGGVWAGGDVASSMRPLDTMPDGLAGVVRLLPMSFNEMMWALALLTPVFIGLWVISAVMSARERRRLASARLGRVAE